MKFKKFTILELLIVIGIIGILITILLPSLQKARDTSMKAVSMSNLKQIGICLFSYATKNGGRLPCTRDPYKRSRGNYSFWPDRVLDISGTNKILNYPGLDNPNKYRSYSAAGGLRGINRKKDILDDFLPRFIPEIHELPKPF